MITHNSCAGRSALLALPAPASSAVLYLLLLGLVLAAATACGSDAENGGSDLGTSDADATLLDFWDADLPLDDVDITGDWYMIRYTYTADSSEVPLQADRATTRFDQTGDTFVQTLDDDFSVPGTVSGSTYTQGDGTFTAVIELDTPNAATGRFEQGAFTFDFSLVRQLPPRSDVSGTWRSATGVYTVTVSGNDITVSGPTDYVGWVAADRALLLAADQPENGSLAALLVFSGDDQAQLETFRTSWNPDGTGHRTFSSSSSSTALTRDGGTPSDCASLNRDTGPTGECTACIASHGTHLEGNDVICCPPGEFSNGAGTECLTCPVSCGEHGECAPSDDGGVACACDSGWHGVVCDEVDDCADVVCENGGTCLDIGDEAICRCPMGVEGDACETVCESEIIPINSCASTATVGPEACETVIDGDLRTGFDLDCSVEGNGYCDYGGGCDVGCITFMDLIAVFPEPYAMSEAWLYSDWWVKRPDTWQVRVADDWDALMARRDREVGSGTTNAAPWQCEDGAACTEEVPDVCCPDGRDQPQRIDSEVPIPRWDVYSFEPDVGEVWVLRVEGGKENSNLVYLQEMAFAGTQCSLDRSCPDGMTLVGDDCVDTDGCAGDPCAEDEVCLDRLPPDTGYDCGARTDPGPQPCDAGPCYEGVSCTNRPGETPDFACGECPAGTTGDGITCTPEEVDPPVVVSTIPAAGATTRLSTGGFNPAEPNRLTVQLDRNVSAAAASASIEHLGSDFSSDLEVRAPTSRDFTILELWPTTPSFPSYPSGEHRVTVTNIRSSEGGVLPEYTWSFTIAGCGDGVCDAAESSCTCSADCGACAGCCLFVGADRSPSSLCRPGTDDDECGNNGMSCGVCSSGCAPGGAGCL